ncbi:hypothetical protein ACH5RR_020268 [Cinchona calisaya]|uniref:Uncharacterized protein n=1 Tax=Cinchona calisaya TaxID=153742 RepID=A0ABD2ZDX8_9GENT
MAKNQPVKRFVTQKDWIFICFGADFRIALLRKQEYQKFVYNVINRYQSQWSKDEKVERDDGFKDSKERPQSEISLKNDVNYSDYEPGFIKYNSDEDDFVTNNTNNKWKLELAWLTKALEPALQFCRWALPTVFFILVLLCPTTLFIFNFLISGVH